MFFEQISCKSNLTAQIKLLHIVSNPEGLVFKSVRGFAMFILIDLQFICRVFKSKFPGHCGRSILEKRNFATFLFKLVSWKSSVQISRQSV